eukprot:320159_1
MAHFRHSLILFWLTLLSFKTNTTSLPVTQTLSANGTYIAVRSLVVNFYEAERYCQSAVGTHLASIHNAQQAQEIYDVMLSAFASIDFAWIGVSDEILNGHFIWTDGTSFDYSRDPLSSVTNQHCWRIMRQSMKWDRTYCDYDSGSLYMICNAQPSWSQPTDFSWLPPVDALGTSLDGAYTLYNHTATFAEADAYCHRMSGTHLVSLTNNDQAEMAQELCSRTAAGTLCWIGLTDMYSNGYEWTDGSDLGFYRWTNTDLTYGCAAITSNGASSTYSWTTNDCNYESKKSVFMCSNYPPTPYPTQAPTQPPITTNPTLYPSVAPTMSPYIMIEVEGSYLCEELVDRAAIVYAIGYTECMDACRHEYRDVCVMINYRADTTPSRCYIFDSQCTLNEDDSGDSRVAFMDSRNSSSCVDLGWNDLNGDTCDAYADILGYCADGTITDDVSVSVIESLANDGGVSGTDACCACGGGATIIDGVTITFEAITMNNQNDLACEWPYGNPSTSSYETWDNVMMYKLCQILKEITNNVDMSCNGFIDSSSSDNINFISCDFDDFSQSNHDLYFGYIISHNVAVQSMDIYFNRDWFQLTSNTATSSTYAQCISSLWSTTSNAMYAVVPCDADIDILPQTTTIMPTTSTTVSVPTYDPTQGLVASEATHIVSTVGVVEPTQWTQDHDNNAKSSTTSQRTSESEGLDPDFDMEHDIDQETLEMISSLLMLLSVVLVVLVIAFSVFVVLYCKGRKTKDGHKYHAQPQTVIDGQRLNVEITNLDIISQGDTPSTDESKALPKEWSKLHTEDGRVYYQNDITKHTQWDCPINMTLN